MRVNATIVGVLGRVAFWDNGFFALYGQEFWGWDLVRDILNFEPNFTLSIIYDETDNLFGEF
jgi:hypothetical protein